MGKPTIARRKRTQRDYPLSFKLSVVEQVEKGEMTYIQAQKRYGIQGTTTVLVWLRKHGQKDWSHTRMPAMPIAKETPAQTIKRLERELEDERLRTLYLNMMVDDIDAHYGTQLRKKLLAELARTLQAKQKAALSRLCRLEGVTRQALYQREKRYKTRQQSLKPLLSMVMELRRYMPRLGTRKLYFLLKPKLKESGIKLGRDGLFHYLRHHQLLVKPKRSYIKTTWSKHWMKKHPNLFSDMVVTRPEQAFVSDITYVESNEGIHYLSLVTDASSRKIMGHELSREMKACDTVKALKRAVGNRVTQKPLVHHSDRGSQYCSAIYQQALAKSNITPSMTDGYDCYQNALAERVNGILKQEFLITRCKTFNELERVIEESIWTYNHRRP
ncbi:IS3 family transposase, partial [Ferrimonas sp.]|uniref:IS3 family transposase n=1 Tax=Ferrimonas sp. TaxID=2080861 RepID=UPI003A8CB667